MFYEVRYYEQVFHPDALKGRGWRSVVIRTINWIRWKLEVINQSIMLRMLAKENLYLSIMLRMLAKENLYNKSEVSQLLRAFKMDVKEEELDKERNSPDFPKPPAPPGPSRSDSYAKSYQQGLEQVGTKLPLRPVPLDELAAKYGNNSRSKRYAKGNGKFTVIDFDDEEIP